MTLDVSLCKRLTKLGTDFQALNETEKRISFWQSACLSLNRAKRAGGNRVKPNVRAWKLVVLICIAAGALLANSTFAPTNVKAHQLSQNEKVKDSNYLQSRDGDLAHGRDKEIAAGAHKVTLDATHLTARGFQLSAFIETGSSTDACLTTYNWSNQWEVLMPILCSPSEYGGKRGIHLVSHLDARPQDNFVVVITVYQPDAQFYGLPVTWELPWR